MKYAYMEINYTVAEPWPAHWR